MAGTILPPLKYNGYQPFLTVMITRGRRELGKSRSELGVRLGRPQFELDEFPQTLGNDGTPLFQCVWLHPVTLNNIFLGCFILSPLPGPTRCVHPWTNAPAATSMSQLPGLF